MDKIKIILSRKQKNKPFFTPRDPVTDRLYTICSEAMEKLPTVVPDNKPVRTEKVSVKASAPAPKQNNSPFKALHTHSGQPKQKEKKLINGEDLTDDKNPTILTRKEIKQLIAEGNMAVKTLPDFKFIAQQLADPNDPALPPPAHWKRTKTHVLKIDDQGNFEKVPSGPKVKTKRKDTPSTSTTLLGPHARNKLFEGKESPYHMLLMFNAMKLRAAKHAFHKEDGHTNVHWWRKIFHPDRSQTEATWSEDKYLKARAAMRLPNYEALQDYAAKNKKPEDPLLGKISAQNELYVHLSKKALVGVGITHEYLYKVGNIRIRTICEKMNLEQKLGMKEYLPVYIFNPENRNETVLEYTHAQQCEDLKQYYKDQHDLAAPKNSQWPAKLFDVSVQELFAHYGIDAEEVRQQRKDEMERNNDDDEDYNESNVPGFRSY